MYKYISTFSLTQPTSAMKSPGKLYFSVTCLFLSVPSNWGVRQTNVADCRVDNALTQDRTSSYTRVTTRRCILVGLIQTTRVKFHGAF